MNTNSAGVWSDFWASGGAGPASGCLPNALRQIDAVQARVWSSVLRGIRQGGRVLDLATGDGAVLAKIQRARRDLKLVGVDSASRLPPPPRGIVLKSGVAMERLPFPPATFDLVTSQFGIEYGDVRTTAGEIAAVLRPNGRFAFLIHFAEGPIVAHNLPRRQALQWVLDQTDLLERARAVARARAMGPLPTPPSFAEFVVEMTRRFPGQPVGAEFAAAVQQTLDYSRGRSVGEALATLDTLERRGRNDVARITALMAAARDEAGILRMIGDLEAGGLRCRAPETVSEAQASRPFGWFVTGQHA